MLGKLTKYELRATYKLFLLAYAVLIVISLINALIPWEKIASDASPMLVTMVSVFQGIFSFLYIIILIGVFILTIAAIIVRFYKNLLGDQGYLMFTLPVKPSALILSKLLVAFIWNVATVIMIGLSLVFFNSRQGVFDLVVDLLRDLSIAGFDIGTWVVIAICLLVLIVITSTLQFYASMSLGMHITKSRLGGTILAYLIIYVANQIISTIVMLVGILIISGKDLDIFSDVVEQANAITIPVILMMVVSYVIVGVGCYMVTHKVLNKKLNLG